MRIRPIRRVAALAATSALTLAACGSPAATTDPTSPATSPVATQGESPTEAPAPGATQVVIGISNPFSGPAAHHGLEAIKGVQLAVSELNASQDDYHYTTAIADDECTPDGGRSAITYLTEVENVSVILTSNCSGAVLGGMSVLAEAEVPGVVTAATNAAITEQAGVGGNEWIFRINSHDGMFAIHFAEYMAEAGVERIAIFATNNDYGRGVAESFKEEFVDLNIEVVSEQYFEQGAGNFRAELTAIQGSGAQAILAPANYPDAIVALRQLRELGMDDIHWYNRADAVSLAFIEASGDPHLGDGIEEATYWDASLSEDPEFQTKLNERFGSEPSLNAYVTYWGTHAIHEAVMAAGSNEPAAIRDALAELDYETPLGVVRFDENNQAASNVFILGFVDGEIQLIERIVP